MAGANLVATLRKQLLARGFTRLPVCRACRFERSVNDFGESGMCLYCERERDLADVRQAATGHAEGTTRDTMIDDGRDYE